MLEVQDLGLNVWVVGMGDTFRQGQALHKYITSGEILRFSVWKTLGRSNATNGTFLCHRGWLETFESYWNSNGNYEKSIGLRYKGFGLKGLGFTGFCV